MFEKANLPKGRDAKSQSKGCFIAYDRWITETVTRNRLPAGWRHIFTAALPCSTRLVDSNSYNRIGEF